MTLLWEGVELALFDVPVVGIHLKAEDVASQQFATICECWHGQTFIKIPLLCCLLRISLTCLVGQSKF